MTADEEAMMDAETVGHLRAVANHVTGGNCAYAIDDATLLGKLAERAIDAGLIDGIRGRQTLRNMERARDERAASADTHPKDGDALAAPFMSGAVGVAETPNG